MKTKLAASFIIALIIPVTAGSHSQLFMKPQARLVANSNQDIAEIRSVWRFEAVSSAVLLGEFDQNASGSLEYQEREQIAKAVRGMSSPFTVETHLVQNGHYVPLMPPAGVRIDVIGNELIISFSVKPKSSVHVAGRLALWLHDSKNNSVFDFKNDSDIKTSGSVFEGCRREVVRLSAAQASTRNRAIATDMFFGNPQWRDRPELTSTRLEINCPG
jgi:ABC-type uncharacterized transport system substrate-binding protein